MQRVNKFYKTGLCLLTILCSLNTYGQGKITTRYIDPLNLPNGITLTGKVKTAVRWTDSSVDNIVITTETGQKASNKVPSDYRDAALYAYHYILNDDRARLTWKVYDFIKECPVDIEANFIKNTFQVTDLNNDGAAEVWLMYQTVCHGDVSPCDMKIIMYQGQQKYTIRGQNKVKVSENEFQGGDYKFDKTFADGPKQFLAFAKELWDKNIMYHWQSFD